MKKSLASTALVIALAAGSGVEAGSTIAPIIDPQPTAPADPAQGGFYGGVLGAYNNGDFTVFPAIPGPSLALTTKGLGLFAGYDFAAGPLHYGLEVDVQTGTGDAAGLPVDVNHLFDLRARVGYDLGPAMAYGFGGYSYGNFTDRLAPITFTADGWNAGLGVQFDLTDNIFVAGEYIYRDISGSVFIPPTIPYRMTTHGIQVKVGFTF